MSLEALVVLSLALVCVVFLHRCGWCVFDKEILKIARHRETTLSDGVTKKDEVDNASREQIVSDNDSVRFCVMEGRKGIIPVRAHDGDAGIDVFAPLDMERVVIPPQGSYLLKTGLRCVCPKGYAMVVHNKSGVAVKKGLIHGACVIDEIYAGEIGIHLINAGVREQTIEPGEKIVQVLLLPVGYHRVEEVTEEECLRHHASSERGEGAYGSTGTVR